MAAKQNTQPKSDIISVVDDIIKQAIIQGASDIHIEPQESAIIVRYRIDGFLKVINKLSLATGHLIISRVKVMCQLDTTGIPRPQEGNIKFVFDGRNVDLRVSIFPTSHSDCVVLRILESVKIYNKYEDLGFTNEQTIILTAAIKKPFGLILATGPTGGGKSTTLFTILDRLNEIDKCLVTLEDPVERKLEMARQTQVNPEVGLTFATGLRFLLRQDPNIIMVGEIRDKETAEIAVQAAITGSLVLSTIHTNNAAGAIIRLINMGIDPFLLSSALRLVTSQRLARLNCPRCLKEYVPPAELINRLQIPKGKKFYRSAGCPACHNTGIKGRIGIHEVFPMNREIEQLILTEPSEEAIKAAVEQRGILTLRQAAMLKAYEGKISLEEALRLTE